MAIADWIRERTERNRRLLIQQARDEGRHEGRQEGRQEGYSMGYEDAAKGKPAQLPKNGSGKRGELG